MSVAILPTKEVFLAHNVVPANDNDAFNDNKCTFCWGPYEDGHPGVRVLPCNHIFGRECLNEMIKAPNGDHCPICRTRLFKPPLEIAIARRLACAIECFASYLISLVHLWNKAIAATASLPRPLPLFVKALHFIGHCWLYGDNPYWHAKLLITHCTNLQERNPDFSLHHEETEYWLLLKCFSIIRIITHWGGSASMKLLLSLIFIPLRLCFGTVKITNHRDRWIFAGIMVVALITHFFAIVFFYLIDIRRVRAAELYVEPDVELYKTTTIEELNALVEEFRLGKQLRPQVN